MQTAPERIAEPTATRLPTWLQWPTLVTLVMFPVLIAVYTKLARREEQDVRAQFGVAWGAYAARTPAFLPRLRRSIHPPVARTS